ncbi:MAG: hypothetical protein AAFV25_24520 [Bacteroidota bacterium]
MTSSKRKNTFTIALTGMAMIALATIATSCATKTTQSKPTAKKKMAATDKEEQNTSTVKKLMRPSAMPQKYSAPESGNDVQHPIEVDLDNQIIQLVKGYTLASESAKSDIRKSFDQSDVYTIFQFCRRACVFGMRNQNDNIKYGLTALSMIDARKFDFRDVLAAMAIVNHGIERRQLDANELYKEAMSHSGPRMTELLTSFQAREAKDKAIKTVAGYTEHPFESGMGLIRCGYKEYAPTKDLSKMAFSIGREIGKDKYHSSEEVTIGESLSTAWTKGQNADGIRKLLNQSLGTAKLSAQLREESTKDWMFQLFLLYLIEFEDKGKASQLQNLLGDEQADTFARLSGSVGTTFYILVSKSTKKGLENQETSKSLQRFRDMIEGEIAKVGGN